MILMQPSFNSHEVSNLKILGLLAKLGSKLVNETIRGEQFDLIAGSTRHEALGNYSIPLGLIRALSNRSFVKLDPNLLLDQVNFFSLISMQLKAHNSMAS